MSKDWTGNKKSTFVILGASSHSTTPRQEHDYYATDPRAIDALNTIMPLDNHSVWEPACGGGHLSKRIAFARICPRGFASRVEWQKRRILQLRLLSTQRRSAHHPLTPELRRTALRPCVGEN